MRPHQDVDAVDLVQRQAFDRAPQWSAADALGQGRAKALRRERDAAGLGEGEPFDQERSARSAARA
jgi:hypothetical protein